MNLNFFFNLCNEVLINNFNSFIKFSKYRLHEVYKSEIIENKKKN